MNWTGGRLKRHSKAHGNPALKAQKKYFAKARQKLQTRSDSVIRPTFSIFQVTSPARQKNSLSRPNTSSPQPTKPSHQSSNRQKRAQEQQNLARAETSQHKPSSHSPSGPRATHASTSRTQKPLDSIKRRLLQHSDWTGLAMAKPAPFKFPSPEQMERIGRRRRVTNRPLRPKREQLAHPPAPNSLVRPFRTRQNNSIIPTAEHPDLSIRVGSNIHQTITHPSVPGNADSPAPPSVTTDSMLLERCEKSQVGDMPPSDINALTPGSLLEQLNEQGNSSLVPLNEALDLKSFDEVRERSSSMVRARNSSSSLFKNTYTTRESPQSGHRGDSGSFPSSSLRKQHHRFTLDHQVALERMSRESISQKSRSTSWNISQRESGTPFSGGHFFPPEIRDIEPPMAGWSDNLEDRGPRKTLAVRNSPSAFSQSDMTSSRSLHENLGPPCGIQQHASQQTNHPSKYQCTPPSAISWMNFVFLGGVGRIQPNFEFGSAPSKDSSRISATTAANTKLFDPNWAHTVPLIDDVPVSETDFLSRFSPMEGVLDERIGDASVYNNAARTEHSLISPPRQFPQQVPMQQRIPAKRKALDDSEGYDISITSLGKHQGHRVALQTLPQPQWEQIIQPGRGHLLFGHQGTSHGAGNEEFEDGSYEPAPVPASSARQREAVLPLGDLSASAKNRTSHNNRPANLPYFSTPKVGIISGSTASNTAPVRIGHSLWQSSPRLPSPGSMAASSGLSTQCPLFGNS